MSSLDICLCRFRYTYLSVRFVVSELTDRPHLVVCLITSYYLCTAAVGGHENIETLFLLFDPLGVLRLSFTVNNEHVYLSSSFV